MWSTAEAKVSKELRPFNGTHATYKTWAKRVKERFIKKNADWYYVFREDEIQKMPIARDTLKVSWLTGLSSVVWGRDTASPNNKL